MSARVLVVDDVLPNVKLLEAKLAREYFEVLTASNGPEALVMAETGAPDIILLDIMMPGMDGFEVCQLLKANPATVHIPVVMVTALSDTTDRVRGLEAGADDFLTKPVSDVALFARVRSLVRLKMTMDEWRVREHTSDELGVLDHDQSELTESAGDAQVLVVEDNSVDGNKIMGTLTSEGHEVEMATTVADGLNAALRTDFDLIVGSLTLMDEDGLRLCSTVRSHERTRQCPILLLGDDHDLQTVAKGLELGANDYLVKPIDRNELLARVRTQIRRRRYQERLRTNYERSLEMALTDELTGLFNRRYLTAHLARAVKRIAESQKPVAALMLDIDHFKQVNDQHGHQVGDEVLKEVAERVTRHLRTFDTVARYGGEEMVVIMPDSSLNSAGAVGERLRRIIADEPIRVSSPTDQVTISVSIGIAVTDDPECPPKDLIRRADEALYEAKGSGRNCVFVDGMGMLNDDMREAANIAVGS